MLIRSQDKRRIVNVNNCNLIATMISCETKHNITVDGMVIGTYSTEEKAIKVLDMIQNNFEDYIKNVVFQMPQDEEVEV